MISQNTIIHHAKAAFQTIVFAAIISADFFLAKLLLPGDILAVYLVTASLAKLAYFYALLTTSLVKNIGKKASQKKKFSYHFFITFLYHWLVFVSFGLLGEKTIPFLLGDQFTPVIPYLPLYILGLMGLALYDVYSTYHTRKVLSNMTTFFLPKQTKNNENHHDFPGKNIAVLIPTYLPSSMTVSLVRAIAQWHPDIHIVVIDDCSPLTTIEAACRLSEINYLAHTRNNITLLRTDKNTLKAGALNTGIAYLKQLPVIPEVVFTFDDDVIINNETIPLMVNALLADEKTGAVCSQVRISNKNKNLLTRLQALEYHSFNITKIADNGFVKGPLVMQGMLTAFRMHALSDTNGFTTGHLIEDYDITARLKMKGWHVKIARKAIAWTAVPHTVEGLWKQRARWTSGGLTVLFRYWKSTPSIYQDVLGHGTFLSLLTLVVLAYMYAETYTPTAVLTPILLISAVINFVIMNVYNVAMLLEYNDRDNLDWFIKFSLFPEFVYSNFLSLILIGSYLFLAYKAMADLILSGITIFYRGSLSAFSRVGYSATWGTR